MSVATLPSETGLDANQRAVRGLMSQRIAVVASLLVTLALLSCAAPTDKPLQSDATAKPPIDVVRLSAEEVENASKEDTKQAIDELMADLKAANRVDGYGDQVFDARFAYNEGDYPKAMQAIQAIRRQMAEGGR